MMKRGMDMTQEEKEYFDDFENDMKIALYQMKTNMKILDDRNRHRNVKEEYKKRRDFFRIKKNVNHYSETIFSWIDRFRESDVGKNIFLLTDNYLWYCHRPNLHCIIQSNGYLEFAIFEPNIIEMLPLYKKFAFTNKKEIEDFVNQLNIGSCNKYIPVLRQIEEMAMDITFDRIKNTIIENTINRPEVMCLCCRLRDKDIKELLYEGRIIER